MVKKTGQNAIKYSIITAFSKKGLDAAEKGLKKLRESFKKTSLANKLTFAAIGAGLTALAAKSIAAANAQDKLQRKLEFSLKTLGETTAIPSVNRFLDTLERQTGIAQDQLIPAFMSLARVTSEMTDAYDALNLALDISFITGDDLATVADAMAKGFAGNATALSKLIPGLDKSAIKAADMQAIMARLNAEFGGAATSQMDTYASKLGRLKVSINKSLEILGAGIIDFLQGFTKTGNVEDLGKALEKMATRFANILRGLPRLFQVAFDEIEKQLKKSWIGRWLLKWIQIQVKAWEKGIKAASEYGYYSTLVPNWGDIWNVKNAKTWSDTVTKTVKTVSRVNWKSLLGEMFDLNKIALAAAKRNGILDKESQTRIEALQALNTEQETDDEIYFKKLLGLSADATAKLIADQNSVAANLKTQLNSQLAAYQDMYAAMKAQYPTGIGPSGTPVTAPRDFGLPPAPTNPLAGFGPGSAIDTYFSGVSGMDYNYTEGMPRNYQPAPVVNVTVNAAAIGSEDYLVGVIGDALTKYTRYGNTTAPAGFI